jgi:outer membrane receptor protein involved in Fe transport
MPLKREYLGVHSRPKLGGLTLSSWLFAAAALCVVFTTLAFAQQTGTATLVGTVSDSTGARVPAAKVTVVNVDTSFRFETQASSLGEYYVPYLSPGSYRITVEAPGFKRFLREGVALRTGETPRIDVVLEVGATSEEVTVTAAAPLLATENAVAGAIVEHKTIADLPISQKRNSKLLLYFPEANPSSGYHVMGQRQRAVGYTLDGVNGKVPGTGVAFGVNDSLNTTLDALEQAKITTTGMSAALGHSAGGSLAVVFKSGTNELHGSANELFVGNRMVQRAFLQEVPTTSSTSFHELDFTAGGPLVIPKLYNGKNKTFWFLAESQHMEHGDFPGTARTVPSEDMLNGDFSFGGIGLPIYNPFTTRQDSTGTWVRDPFPGNKIAPSLFDPAVMNFLSHDPFVKPNYPATPTKTGPVNNYMAPSEPKTVFRYRWDTKLDHQFGPNHKIFGRYSQARHRADRSQKYPEFAWNILDYNSSKIPVDIVNVVFNDTVVLGPTRFNEVLLGMNRRHFTLTSLSQNQDWAQKLGIPNVSGTTFPFFNIGFRMTAMNQSEEVGDDYTLQDNFTQILGPHNLKIGYELIRTRYNYVLPDQPGGTYNFGGTEMPFTPNTGNTFASFLLGTVSSAVFTQDFGSWLPHWWQHAFYVQDDWKVARNLSLSLGLRWDYESPFQTKHGQQSQFDPTVVDPLTGIMGAIRHPTGQLAKRDLNNFQPRLGLSWNFRSKWVFRSSFAVMVPDLMTNGVGQNFNDYQGTANIQAPPGDPRHVFRLSQGPPPFSYPVQADGSVAYVGTNYGGRNADWYDPNMRSPYIMSWSAGFQNQLTPTWLLELLYQASAGVKLLNAVNIDMIPLDISTDPVVLNKIYQSTQTYKPYPQFGNVYLYSNLGHNTHHAGTVRVEKRYSAGLTLSAWYTFSKTMDNSDGEGTISGITPYNLSLEKARAGFDVAHKFESILTIELPFGKGRKLVNRGGVLNHLLGGWGITWVQAAESGLPNTITYSGSPYKYLPQGESRPNALVPMDQAVVQNWTIGPHRFPTSAQNPYLKFSAFAYPAAFTAGTLGRNVFEAPGMFWTQLSVMKTWTIRERVRISPRVDMNNLPFKGPQYTAPNSTYNVNNPSLFGTFTGTRGDWSNYGSGNPNIQIECRLEF